jgi:hypothetical protein
VKIDGKVRMTMEKSLDNFIRMVYNKKFQSVWTCCLGPNQSGKTDWNLYQMERLHALGLADGFGSNMPLEADFDIDFIEDFDTLKKRCHMLNPDPEKHGIKRYFFLGSEMGDWAPRDQPWLNVKFIKELQQVRKYGLNFLGDGIARIDARILNEKHFHGYFEKISKANPKVAIYYDWFSNRKRYLEDIPRTSIKFNTWYSASFYMEPHTEGADIPLNADHLIVKQYLEAGCSIAKTGLFANEVKRARDRVLKYYWEHYLEPSYDKDNTVAEHSSVEES